jgi:hypothetical protein
MSETITFEGKEYRQQGGELHRRPVKLEEGEYRTPVELSWLVLNQDDDVIPEIIRQHFNQAKDRAAVD